DPTQPDQLVNPFNGKPLSVEQIQQELELSQYRTQLLEEQLKQTNAVAELSNVPLRKGVEAAQARTQLSKEELSLKVVQDQLYPAPPPPPPPPPPPKSEEEVKREAAAKRAAERKAQREAKELAAKTPPATLLSVVQMGNERSVVLDIKGNV